MIQPDVFGHTHSSSLLHRLELNLNTGVKVTNDHNIFWLDKDANDIAFKCDLDGSEFNEFLETSFSYFADT
jgi:hypothetical protein